MKKVSTVGPKQTNNFSEQKLTIGLDLGDQAGIACWMKRVKCCWNRNWAQLRWP
jgi:hypothetical protein